MKCPKCSHVFKESLLKHNNTHFFLNGSNKALCGTKVHPDDEHRKVRRVSDITCWMCLKMVLARVKDHAKALQELIELHQIAGLEEKDRLPFPAPPEALEFEA